MPESLWLAWCCWRLWVPPAGRAGTNTTACGAPGCDKTPDTGTGKWVKLILGGYQRFRKGDLRVGHGPRIGINWDFQCICNYDRSEAKRVLYENIVYNVTREPAQPWRFLSLNISETTRANDSEFSHMVVYIVNYKLSSFRNDQRLFVVRTAVLREVGEKVFFEKTFLVFQL